MITLTATALYNKRHNEDPMRPLLPWIGTATQDSHFLAQGFGSTERKAELDALRNALRILRLDDIAQTQQGNE